jgi:hypothetical protein
MVPGVKAPYYLVFKATAATVKGVVPFVRELLLHFQPCHRLALIPLAGLSRIISSPKK